MYFKITKETEQVYKLHKKYIPCFDDSCPVGMMCCKETKASRGAKHLRYTIHLKNPCQQARVILSAIDSIPQLKRRAKEELRKYNYHLDLYKFCISDISKYTQLLKKLRVKNKKLTSKGKI